MCRQQRRGGRFPDHRVAHQCRRRGQVAGDRREVERRDRQHETLERPVLHAVPLTRRRHRLFLLDALAEVHVPAPEVDELARRVDLRLVNALALTEDGRRVEPVAPRTAEQVGGAQKHRGARLPGGGRPGRPCGQRRIHSAAHVSGGRLAGFTELQLVPVRRPDLELTARTLKGLTADVLVQSVRSQRGGGV